MNCNMPIMPFSHHHAEPMREWNRNALICLKGDLKLSVKVKESGILDMLAIPTELGFLNQAEMQSVAAMTNSMEQMDKIVEILLGKEDKCFGNFCDILTNSNNEVLANSLRVKAEEFRSGSGKCPQHFLMQTHVGYLVVTPFLCCMLGLHELTTVCTYLCLWG